MNWSSLHVGSEPGAHSTQAGPCFVSAHLVPAPQGCGHTMGASAGANGETGALLSGTRCSGALEEVLLAGVAGVGRSGAACRDPHARKRTALRVETSTDRRIEGEHRREAQAGQAPS